MVEKIELFLELIQAIAWVIITIIIAFNINIVFGVFLLITYILLWSLRLINYTKELKE